MDVTVGWCTEFEPGWRVHRLLHASRPPALFQFQLGRYLAQVGQPLIGRSILDEDLGEDALEPAVAAAVAGSEIAYLSSHGRMAGSTYRFRLRRGEWSPTAGAALSGPGVLILDTCNVVNTLTPPEQTDWVKRGRPTPAVVLGFVGAASDGYQASMRGRCLANHLAVGETFVQAWFNAIQDTQQRRYRDRAIAIAFGPNQAAAFRTFQEASLLRMPTPTTADSCYSREK